MGIYPKNVKEIRYYKDEKLYANLEYSSMRDSIKFSCPEEKINLIFTSKEKEKIEFFWDNLAKKSLDKELENLNNILEKMKSKFEFEKL
jgi:hypothetical protein